MLQSEEQQQWGSKERDRQTKGKHEMNRHHNHEPGMKIKQCSKEGRNAFCRINLHARTL